MDCRSRDASVSSSTSPTMALAGFGGQGLAACLWQGWARAVQYAVGAQASQVRLDARVRVGRPLQATSSLAAPNSHIVATDYVQPQSHDIHSRLRGTEQRRQEEGH
jgi:hypothetical protein